MIGGTSSPACGGGNWVETSGAGADMTGGMSSPPCGEGNSVETAGAGSCSIVGMPSPPCRGDNSGKEHGAGAIGSSVVTIASPSAVRSKAGLRQTLDWTAAHPTAK